MRWFDQLKKVVQFIRPLKEDVIRKKEVPEQQFQKQKYQEDSNGKNQLVLYEEITSINLFKNETMTMFNYGVGGNEIKVDANDAIQEIQGNKSLLVAKLTTNEAVSPEIVTGLKTVDQVFQYYAPAMEVVHSTPEGQTVKEEFRFNNLGDFTPKKMVENSSFLKGLQVDEEQHNKIMNQLRSNKMFQRMLEDEEKKRDFAETLKAIARELEQ